MNTIFDQSNSEICHAQFVRHFRRFLRSLQRIFGVDKPNSATKKLVTIHAKLRFHKYTQESLQVLPKQGSGQ